MPGTDQTTPHSTLARQRDLTRRLTLVALGLCLVASLLISSTTEAGQVYRWTTSDGTVHYGEHPPQGVEATQMSTTTGKPSKQSSRRERVEPGEYSGEEPAAESKDETAAAEVAPPKPKKNKDICERAKYNLKVLTDRARIRQTDENGEERYLSDEEKDKQKEKAREAIKTYC